MPTDRRVRASSLLRRAAAALAVMTLVMLLVAALGRWVLVPSDWARSVDAGGVTAGTDLLLSAPWLADAAQVWSALSGPWVVHPLVITLTLVLLARGRVTRSALAVPAIGLVGWALGALCKELVQRSRPEDAVVSYGSWSFPSGHATNVALGTVLVIALLGAVRTAWIRWSAGVLVVAGALLTAVDRIVLGVHYVTDVGAGLLLGALLALVGLALLRPTATPPPCP